MTYAMEGFFVACTGLKADPVDGSEALNTG